MPRNGQHLSRLGETFDEWMSPDHSRDNYDLTGLEDAFDEWMSLDYSWDDHDEDEYEARYQHECFEQVFKTQHFPWDNYNEDEYEAIFRSEWTEERSEMRTYPIYWIYLRGRVLIRDGFTCQMCGKQAPVAPRFGYKLGLQVHHIEPLSMGGSNELDNLLTVCIECHEEIHPHLQGS